MSRHWWMTALKRPQLYPISSALARLLCGMKLQNRVPSKELRERLGLVDIISVLQQNRLWWYGHVLQKEDNDWVKKYMEYEVECARPRGRGRPTKTWDNPGEPVPEETFTHSHPSWSSNIPICFLHLLRSMASSLFNPRTLQSFSTISLQVFFGLCLS